ncbi:hypothetical protein HK104_007407 [Borealophlyctis nickersoniae]|nr:hypothetical protein HK104_007407 [Borealophlyctis nickersoniae]
MYARTIRYATAGGAELVDSLQAKASKYEEEEKLRSFVVTGKLTKRLLGVMQAAPLKQGFELTTAEYAREQQEKKAAKKGAIEVPDRVPRKGGKTAKGGKGVEQEVVNVESETESVNAEDNFNIDQLLEEIEQEEESEEPPAKPQKSKRGKAKDPPKTPQFVEEEEEEIMFAKPTAKRARKAKPKSTEETKSDVPSDVPPPTSRTRASTARKSRTAKTSDTGTSDGEEENETIGYFDWFNAHWEDGPHFINVIRPPNSPSGRSGQVEQEIYLYTG